VNRYFSKINPKQDLLLSNGSWFNSLASWEPVGDGESGVLATNNGFLIREMELAMERQRGGIREISQSEFETLKKKEPNLKPWRPLNEAISKATYARLRSLWSGNAGAVAGVEITNPKGAGRKIAQPTIISQFRPASVKR
jgi:hypothetical protein